MQISVCVLRCQIFLIQNMYHPTKPITCSWSSMYRRVSKRNAEVSTHAWHAPQQEVLGTVSLYIRNHIYLLGVAGEGVHTWV